MKRTCCRYASNGCTLSNTELIFLHFQFVIAKEHHLNWFVHVCCFVALPFQLTRQLTCNNALKSISSLETAPRSYGEFYVQHQFLTLNVDSYWRCKKTKQNKGKNSFREPSKSMQFDCVCLKCIWNDDNINKRAPKLELAWAGGKIECVSQRLNAHYTRFIGNLVDAKKFFSSVVWKWINNGLMRKLSTTHTHTRK